MSFKLDERQRAEIIAAYAQGGASYYSLGEKYGVSYKTIERVVKSDTKLSEKVKEIKIQNAVNVTEHIRGKSGEAMTLFDDILSELRSKVKTATPRELFGGLKIISDIFHPQESAGKDGEDVKVVINFADTSGAASAAEPSAEQTEVAQDD